MATILYDSDFTLLETIEDIDGNEIDPRTINFVISYYTDGQNKYQASHKNGKYVNCAYDADSGKLIVIFAKHGLRPGILKHKLMVMSDDSLFPLGIRNDKSLAAIDITLSLTGGDAYTAEATMMVPALQITHSATLKDDIIDADEVNYLDSENNFSLVKTTWLNIIAKLRAVFNLEYEPKKATGENYVSDSELEVLQNTSGENTGDETAESIIDKIGTDGQIKSDYLPSYVDDVIEGYYFEAAFYYDSSHTELITAEQGKIYVDIPTNFSYRYSGSAYINISNPLDYSADIEADKTSTTKVSAIKTLYDWATGKFIALSKLVTTWTATTLDTNVPSEKLVKDSLNLKADITPANGATSALRNLFTSVPGANCVYNTNTGYYEMNGITNLTEAQLLAAYPIALNVFDFRGLMRYVSIRTNFPVQVMSYTDIRLNLSSFMLASTLEVLVFRTHTALGNKVHVSSLAGSFRFCSSLKKIIGVLDVSAVTDFSGSFASLGAFEQIELFGLKANIAFPGSPLLNLYTLQYMVTNRANGTSRITITVHPTVWGYLNDAVNYPTWNALLVDAVNNQYIDFASA